MQLPHTAASMGGRGATQHQGGGQGGAAPPLMPNRQRSAAGHPQMPGRLGQASTNFGAYHGPMARASSPYMGPHGSSSTRIVTK